MRPWNGKEIFVNLQKQPQLFLKNDNDIMERFRIVHGDMFSKYDSGSLSRSRDKQVSDAIARLSDDYVLNVNEEDYIQYLIDEYTLYMPVIHFDDVRIETRKVLVDPEYLPRYWGAQKAIERTMVRYISLSAETAICCISVHHHFLFLALAISTLYPMKSTKTFWLSMMMQSKSSGSMNQRKTAV